MKPILTIARRELKALFDSPTGYVLLVVFLAVNAFLFFRQAYLTSTASLRPMLDLLPWLLLFFVPAVAMRTLAEDNRSGQLEVVLAQPVTELELLVGKYLGAVGFLWLALVVSLAIPLGLSLGAELAWGPIVAQYAGAMLLAAGLAGVGVWASSVTRSQITAFIVAVAVMFVLVLVGLNPLVVGLPPTLAAVAARLGVLSHFDSIGRGVIDLRDAIYFVSLAAIFLTLAYGALMARKLAHGQAPLRRLRLGVLLVVSLLVIVNLAGSYIGGRIDLTPGRVYTLAPATRTLVRNLDDIVTLKLFASTELPAEVALMKRDLDDLLSDLRSAGRGSVRLLERDPASDPEAAREARSLGINPVQFNVVGRSELQVKEGYLGLVVQYADQHETIPFIRRTDDLEYRIAATIRSLTRSQKPLLGLVAAMPDWGVEGRDFSLIEEQLSRSYTVVPVSLGDTTQPGDSLTTLILLGQPDSLHPRVYENFKRFFARGGSALIMASGAPILGAEPRAVAEKPIWNMVLEPYGVSVRPDMAYDLGANALVPVPGPRGNQPVLRPYPFWLRALAAPGNLVTEGVGEVFLPWTSTIDTSGQHPGKVTPLLVSSRLAGVAEGTIDLTPTRTFPGVDLAPRLLAVQVEPDSASGLGRLVLVGNMEFATDRYLGNAPENATFALNAIDWLTQDLALVTIRSRDRTPPRLLFTSQAVAQGVKYFNMVGVPVLVALVGLVRLVARRRRALEPWRPLAGGAA
jgi:ABC-type uncharacterized transport system involved in gliding motility auxiliary subunit/ABC-type transport system involved in multi-copper enzyme maturation permease subunit